MYGTQTSSWRHDPTDWFENDVKMYGTQTIYVLLCYTYMFENDVKMYGTQTSPSTAIGGS